MYRLALTTVASVVLVVLVCWVCHPRWGSTPRVERLGSWPRSSPVFDVARTDRIGITVVSSQRYCGGERPLPAFYFEVLEQEPIEEWLPRWAHPRAERDRTYAPCERHVSEIASGLPFRALQRTELPTGRGSTVTAGPRGGLRLGWPARRSVVLPVTPIWKGLLLNSLLYASVLALLVESWRRLRGRQRRRAGRCPRCAFLLVVAGPTGCPECGWERERDTV